MTEGTSEHLEPGEPITDPEETPITGVAELDEVIAAVAALGGQGIDDHVATLESAHQALRQALDQPRSAD